MFSYDSHFYYCVSFHSWGAGVEDWYGGSGWDWAGHSRAGAGQLHQTESIPRKPVGVLSCGGCGIHSGSNAPPPPLGPGCCCPPLLFLQGEKSYPKGFLLVLSCGGLGDGVTQVKCFPHFLCSRPQSLRSPGLLQLLNCSVELSWSNFCT